MKPLFRHHILAICIFYSFTLLSCSETYFQSHKRYIDSDKEADQIMHTHTGLNSAVLIETDTDLDGKIDDYLWVNGKADQKDSSMILYNEAYKDGKVVRKTWYGPGNLKLIEISDEDNDGYMETATYYNLNAKPKVLTGIVARSEIDTNKDKKTDLWIFPGKRLEWDQDYDGTPDCFLAGSKLGQIDLEKLSDLSLLRQSECSKLKGRDSFVVHSNLIESIQNKAVLELPMSSNKN